MTFTRPPAGDDPQWPRASTWLAGGLEPPTREHAPTVRVCGVPVSVGSISPSRADQTPGAVRDALARLSPFDPVTGFDLAKAVAVEDLGDWDLTGLDLVPAIDRARELAGALDRDEAVHVFLGGDNSITRPVVSGLHGPDLSRVAVVTLDAHHDVRHLEDGPRNGTPILGLVEDGLPPTNVVQIGIGRFTNSAPYAAWCAMKGIATVTAADVHARGTEPILDQLREHLDGVDLVHLDIDVDVLDVAFAPACPGARPGGLNPDQLFALVTGIARDPRVASADLVEVDATTDHDGRTVMVTAMTLLAFVAGVAAR